MSQLLEIFLGIMTALGGFVDIGEVVFASQAGARIGVGLLWPFVVGTIGIVVYSEMCGRIAAVAKAPVFETIKRRLPRSLAATTFVASTMVNLITCFAEIGGIAILLRLLTGQQHRFWPLVAAATLGLLVWFLPFKWIERVFGLAGLTILVFAAAAIAVHPDWSAVARGLLPAAAPSGHGLLYAYMAVGIVSSVMMPYEVYFYSSGGIEEKWKPRDLPMNRLNTALGFALGALVAMAFLVLAAHVFQPRQIDPQQVGSSALLVGVPFGDLGIVMGLIGILMAVAGAAVETALAGAYNFAQYFDLPWGRARRKAEAPLFNAAWIAMLVAGALVNLAEPDPVDLVEMSVMFAVVCLPLTYLPILLAARDRS